MRDHLLVTETIQSGQAGMDLLKTNDTKQPRKKWGRWWRGWGVGRQEKLTQHIPSLPLQQLCSKLYHNWLPTEGAVLVSTHLSIKTTSNKSHTFRAPCKICKMLKCLSTKTVEAKQLLKHVIWQPMWSNLRNQWAAASTLPNSEWKLLVQGACQEQS